MSHDLFSDIAKTFTLTKLPDSEIELSGDIPPEIIALYSKKALEEIARSLKLPGFREGHVPEEIARKKVGDIAVLEGAVALCIKEFYPVLITQKNVDAVGQPAIRLTKLAPGNPVGVVLKTAVYPAVSLPKDWKTLGTKIPPVVEGAVTEEEVLKMLTSLQENHKQEKGDGAQDLPEINDAFAKSLGAFENLDALKKQIRQGIQEEKERVAHDTYRGHIIDALLQKVVVTIPKIFVESELDKIIGQMRQDITRFNMTFEAYLERTQKTEESVRNEFEAQAAKRAKLQLTLNKIAELEKITADTDAVEREMKYALEHFPNAKPELVRIHIETVLRNEKALQLLESRDKKE